MWVVTLLLLLQVFLCGNAISFVYKSFECETFSYSAVAVRLGKYQYLLTVSTAWQILTIEEYSSDLGNFCATQKLCRKSQGILLSLDLALMHTVVTRNVGHKFELVPCKIGVTLLSQKVKIMPHSSQAPLLSDELRACYWPVSTMQPTEVTLRCNCYEVRFSLPYYFFPLGLGLETCGLRQVLVVQPRPERECGVAVSKSLATKGFYLRDPDPTPASSLHFGMGLH